jgi:putative membrane protein
VVQAGALHAEMQGADRSTFMSTSPVFPRLVAACAVALALTACQKDGSSSRPEGEEGAARPENREGASLTTPEIFGVARAINEAEVEQATAVQGRLRNPAATRFAEQMIRDHGAAIEQLSALSSELAIAPADSDLRQKLVREAQDIMQRLSNASPTDLDQEYLDSQVTMHRRALEVLDDELIPAAEEQRLRQQLTTMRGHVAAHLSQAEQLQSK